MTDYPEALIERCAEKVHQSYCSYYEQVHGKPYWTKGDYSKLSEEVKEFDRASVRAALDASGLREAQQERDIYRRELNKSSEALFILRAERDALRKALASLEAPSEALIDRAWQIATTTGADLSRAQLHDICQALADEILYEHGDAEGEEPHAATSGEI